MQAHAAAVATAAAAGGTLSEAEHEWYFYPEMRSDEALMFISYDSTGTHAGATTAATAAVGACRGSAFLLCLLFRHHSAA